jgi:SAM-dependent methyltransferase
LKQPSFQRLKLFQPAGNNYSHGLFRLKDFPGFSARDLRALELYYAAQLSRHESPERRVGWQNPESQRVRFEALASVGPLANSKILDVGCGLGGFLGYLKEQKTPVNYTGVDLFANVIREAKQLHPQVKFEARVLTANPYPVRSFEYSFLSGVFNVKVKDNWEYMRALLGSVLKQTKTAVAFNALNVEAGLREPDRFTTQARDLVSFGRRLGVSRVHLMDHYHHLDLTLFLYK